MPQVRVLPIISVGADPELFVRDKETKKIVSAHNLLPGTKEKPYAVPGGAVQVDGLAAEFNIDPKTNGPEFERACHGVIKELQKILGPKYDLVYEPAHVFDQEYYDSLPDDPKVLGCTADFNGYTVSVNPPPDTEEFPTMRTTSGHVHVGWARPGFSFDVEDPNHIEDCAAMARQMDFALGIPSLAWDPDPRRRKMYGKAGCFRPKPYGMEYRALSNVWLRPNLVKSSIDYRREYNGTGLPAWIADRVIIAAKDLFNGIAYEKGPWGENAAQGIIDNNVTEWMYMPEFRGLAKQTKYPRIDKPENPANKKPAAGHYTTGGRKEAAPTTEVNA